MRRREPGTGAATAGLFSTSPGWSEGGRYYRAGAATNFVKVPRYTVRGRSVGQIVWAEVHGREAKVRADRDQRAGLRIVGRLGHELRGAEYLSRGRRDRYRK